MDDLDGRGVEENSSSSESESRPLTERRKGLATHTNRMKQLREKLKRLLQEEDPAELDLDELQESKDSVASIKRKATGEYDALYQEETDESLRESDEHDWTSLQEVIRRVSVLSSKLISIKSAQSWVKEVDEQLDELVAQAAGNPDMSFAKGIADLEHANSQLKTVIRNSTIPETHSLRTVAKEINGRVILLMATKKVEPAGGGADVKPHLHSSYKLPRIELPQFDGQLQRWNGFWIEFEEAVHNNNSLSPTQKLTYLRQCMGTANLKELLLPTSKDPARYSELITMLKKRYDKPRKLHHLHSRALAELPTCKNTAEDLLAGGDRLHKAVAVLVDLDQSDVHSIGTSLGVSTLPPVLQTEWETLTQGQEQVPPVEQLIAFMRQKPP